MPYELEDLVKLHQGILDKTPRYDWKTKARLLHALDDFKVWIKAQEASDKHFEEVRNLQPKGEIG